MPRGGKRPGAGAPKGNLNALKHGERSKQFARVGEIIAASPRARAILLRYADRFDAEQRKADEIAATVIEGILRRGLSRGRDRQLYLLPEPTIEERTIRQISATSPVPERADGVNAENTPSDNQSTDSKSAIQSENPEGKCND